MDSVSLLSHGFHDLNRAVLLLHALALVPWALERDPSRSIGARLDRGRRRIEGVQCLASLALARHGDLSISEEGVLAGVCCVANVLAIFIDDTLYYLSGAKEEVIHELGALRESTDSRPTANTARRQRKSPPGGAGRARMAQQPATRN